MEKSRLCIGAGVLLTIGSIGAAVLFGFSFWYSLLALGLVLLFGGLNYRNNTSSVLQYVLEKDWKSLSMLYLATALVMGLVGDVIYGRLIGNLWIYPPLTGIWNYLVPILIYYPLGCFQVYETFHFFKDLSARTFRDAPRFTLPSWLAESLMQTVLVLAAIGLFAPLLNLLVPFANNSTLMILSMCFFIFSFDALLHKKGQPSLLLETLRGNTAVITTLLSSWLLNFFLTEIPNLYSFEWVYLNWNLVDINVFGLNIMIFTFGYFFLVYTITEFIDYLKLTAQI